MLLAAEIVDGWKALPWLQRLRLTQPPLQRSLWVNSFRIKVTRQGKLGPAIAECGLKSYRHNFSALKRGAVCSAV